MPGRLQFEFTFGKPRQDRSRGREQHHQHAMRLLMMGDFSGRSSRDSHETGDQLARRRIIPVDIDSFNATMTRIAPQLHLSIGETTELGVKISFAGLNDFHPDQLYSKLELFQDLRALRARLTNATTFPQAKADLLRTVQVQTVAETTNLSNDEREPALAEVESDDATFERLLGKQKGAEKSSGVRQTQSQATIQRLISDIVKPYVELEAEPFQAQYVAALDEAISRKMQQVLHHPEFQDLEALWRSAYTLVSGLETGEELKLYLLDISKQELIDDIKATQGQLAQTQLYKLLVDEGAGTLGGEYWSTIVGDYTFTTDSKDLSLLASLGAISSQAGGPFIAAADACLLGCQSVVNTPDPRDWQYDDNEAEQNWLALRESEVADWIGLAHPRVLLRLPYGKNSDTLDNFEFEELGSEREHEYYLWGNPAFTCAFLLALAYQTHGWSMQPGDILEVQDLPAYSYKEDDEMKLMACAEAFLTEHAAETMLDRGLMPLMSYRNRNVVRLMRFQSIAKPIKALAGPWA